MKSYPMYVKGLMAYAILFFVVMSISTLITPPPDASDDIPGYLGISLVIALIGYLYTKRSTWTSLVAVALSVPLGFYGSLWVFTFFIFPENTGLEEVIVTVALGLGVLLLLASLVGGIRDMIRRKKQSPTSL